LCERKESARAVKTLNSERERRQTAKRRQIQLSASEEVRRGDGVKVMKINHHPLENENLACQL